MQNKTNVKCKITFLKYFDDIEIETSYLLSALIALFYESRGVLKRYSDLHHPKDTKHGSTIL